MSDDKTEPAGSRRATTARPNPAPRPTGREPFAVGVTTPRPRPAPASNVDKTPVRQPKPAPRSASNVDKRGPAPKSTSNVDKDAWTREPGKGGGSANRTESARAKVRPIDPFSFDELDVQDPTPEEVSDPFVDLPDSWRDIDRNRREGMVRADGRTVSGQTGAEYMRRANQLVRRYRRENKIPAEVELSLSEFANWLLAMKPRLRPNSWRGYRNAAIYYIEATGDGTTNEALRLLRNDFVEETDENASTGQRAATGRGREASTMKAKSVKKGHFDKLVAYLLNISRSPLADIAAEWLQASLWTGLRPIEWQATVVREEPVEDGDGNRPMRTVLKVLSAKTTNGRGNDVVRTLDITDLSDEQKVIIENTSIQGARWYIEGEFPQRKDQLSNIIYEAFDRIFPTEPRRVSLYTMRHQFIANAKSFMEQEEIAAMVGHGITRTQEEHYGKRRSAWGPDDMPSMPKPVSREVDLVRARISHHKRYVRRHIESGLDPSDVWWDPEDPESWPV